MRKRRDLTDYKSARELVQVTDPYYQKPLYRRPGFDGVVNFEEIDAKLADFLTERREKTGMTKGDFASLIGLSRMVYGRYELNISRLTVSRLVHLSELLGFLPLEMIHAGAPHLFGKTSQEANDRAELMRLVSDLPHESIRNLLGIVSQLTPSDGHQAHPKAKTEEEHQTTVETEPVLNSKNVNPDASPGKRGRPRGSKESK